MLGFAMRPLWKGAISFGLVNIPVSLYSAVKPKRTIDFDMLRDADHSRIRYKKVAESDGQEVPKEHIVKGYEYEKDQYVVIMPEDFQRVQIASNQLIEIKEFVELAEIDPRFFDAPYLLAPEKSGQKAYGLLQAALEKSGKAGIAKVVLRPPREHLALIKPLEGILVMETMYFADELADPGELNIPTSPAGEKELNMSLSLIETLSDTWDPNKYHDEYRTALMSLIDKKVEAGDKGLPAPQPGVQPKKIVDLVSVLQQSISEAGKHTKGKKALPPRKKAA
jgi:DNA end-binding protein Ku